MCIYIEICTVQGNIELNSIFSFLVGIQPFKVNGTWMTSFLINSIMMLISCFGLINYLTMEFQSYLRGTACERIWKVILSNTKYIKHIYRYKVHSYFFVIFFILVTLFLLALPSKKSKITKLMRDKKRERM